MFTAKYAHLCLAFYNKKLTRNHKDLILDDKSKIDIVIKTSMKNEDPFYMKIKRGQSIIV